MLAALEALLAYVGDAVRWLLGPFDDRPPHDTLASPLTTVAPW